MLPRTVFDQLTRTTGLRTEKPSPERRGAPRIPLRAVGTAHRIDGGIVGPSLAIRIKDISTTGISLLTVGRDALGGEFLVRVTAGTTPPQWLWCALRRRSEFDRTCTVLSAAFLKLLRPGQFLSPGRDFISLDWADIEGDQTPDEKGWMRTAI